MNNLLLLVTQYDEDGNVVSVEPIIATIVDTPEALDYLLDSAEAATVN
jgi:hypothetical protein